MAIDKAIEYKMQGGKKPATNDLGKHKTVSKVPVKWNTGPDTHPTVLTYIQVAETDLLLIAYLHTSSQDVTKTDTDSITYLSSQRS